MGNIFPKPASNLEKLDRIVKDINHSEAYYFELQRKRELWVNNLITYGVSAYLLIGVLMYVTRWGDSPGIKKFNKIYYVLYPVILIILKEFVTWVFNLRLDNTTSKLNSLRSQKRELMYEIMKKEPYEKYKHSTVRNEKSVLRNIPQRNLDSRVVPSKERLPDKLSEFMSGERCCSRFALICSRCGTHNGKVLGEEFDYVTFKCYNCHFLNPSRKVRQCAPRFGTHLTA